MGLVPWLWWWFSEDTLMEKLLEMYVLNMCIFCVSLLPQWSWERFLKRFTNVCSFNEGIKMAHAWVTNILLGKEESLDNSFVCIMIMLHKMDYVWE